MGKYWAKKFPCKKTINKKLRKICEKRPCLHFIGTNFNHIIDKNWLIQMINIIEFLEISTRSA